MAKKVSVEEQVAQLTQEQQNKIVLVGKIAIILQIIGGVPGLIVALVNLYILINPPLGISSEAYDVVFTTLMIWLAIVFVYILGILVVAKIICPYYSDAKYSYIKKMRKSK